MRPPVPRFIRWAVALAVIAALTLAVFQYWGTSQYGAAVARSGQVTGLPAPQPAAVEVAATGPHQRIDQVVNVTAVPAVNGVIGSDANAMLAALISIAALLIALGLLGSTGRRVPRPAAGPQHRGARRLPRQRRHAAHRW